VSHTDKFEGGYVPVYETIADQIGPKGRVCELGVYKGDSLRLWQELFPEGEVTGVDCNHGCTWPDGTRKVVMDQADPELAGVLGGPFDLIVDDASHVGALTMASFMNLWPLVAPEGHYVIEDWMIGLAVFEGHPMHDPEMFRVVSSLLGMLSSQDADVEQVTYRYGLAIISKAPE